MLTSLFTSAIEAEISANLIIFECCVSMTPANTRERHKEWFDPTAKTTGDRRLTHGA